MLIPSLPPEAIGKIAAWRNTGGIAFQRILETLPLQCKNCGDVEVVYVSFCKSERRTYIGGGVSLWFEGDESAPKGWYTIEATAGFPCPKCQQQ